MNLFSFVLGSLVGMLVGGALIIHHLRAEIAANIGPTLERMQYQLDLIESAVDIALTKWYEVLRSYPPRPPEVPPTDHHDDRALIGRSRRTRRTAESELETGRSRALSALSSHTGQHDHVVQYRDYADPVRSQSVIDLLVQANTLIEDQSFHDALDSQL
jgi:hypothetical protein